jgi:hypothetical protein
MYCSSCGIKCADQAKFCHGCGAALPDTAAGVASVLASDSAPEDSTATVQSPDDFTSSAAPIPPTSPRVDVAPEPVEADPPPYVLPEIETETRAWWKSPGAIIAGATLLFAFLAWCTSDLWLGMDKTAISNSVSASNAVTSDTAVTQSYFVTRTAKLRDRATTVGSVIKGEAPRGSELKGSLIIGDDEKSQWLKVAETGYFISLANLATTQPLPLSITINKTVTIDEASQVRAEPADEAALIDTLSVGAKVDAIGVVNGWIEIGLKKGGVGYFKPSATSANIGLLTGKAVAVVPATVDFDALATISEGSCNFGGQMDRIFAAMNNASGKGPFAIAGVGQSLVATAEGADPSPVTMSVKGTLKGLSVTGLFTSVDGSGFYFGDSVAAVGKAMSAFGYTASEDGNTYSNSEDGTGGYISRQGNRTALLCDN